MDEMRVAVAAMVLASKAEGFCGSKCQAFVDFMRALGYEARQIGYMFERDGPETHVTAEVRIGGVWRTFDVHWRTYWDGDQVIVTDENWLVSQPELDGGRRGAFDYLTAPTRRWVLYYENAETGERWDA